MNMPPNGKEEQLIMWCSWADGCAWETTVLLAILKTSAAADRPQKLE